MKGNSIYLHLSIPPGISGYFGGGPACAGDLGTSGGGREGKVEVAPSGSESLERQLREFLSASDRFMTRNKNGVVKSVNQSGSRTL